MMPLPVSLYLWFSALLLLLGGRWGVLDAHVAMFGLVLWLGLGVTIELLRFFQGGVAEEEQRLVGEEEVLD